MASDNGFPHSSGSVMIQNKGIRKAGIGAVMATILLAGCAAPPPGPIENDPNEALNRKVHAFNKGLDRALLRPASDVYGVVPNPVQRGIGNFAANLDLPGDVLNNLLQNNGPDAANNAGRFVINTVFGLAGILDAASVMGLPHRKTDFGETLHHYGMAEGAYVELPGFGPSTERDTVGLILDFALNPVGKLAEGDDAKIASGAKVLSKLGDRHRYSGTVDSILYDSADSYAQARMLYLQNRRFELGQTGGDAAGAEEGFIDPYEDPYGNE